MLEHDSANRNRKENRFSRFAITSNVKCEIVLKARTTMMKQEKNSPWLGLALGLKIERRIWPEN
jgi:hypothetical protein